MDSSSKERGEKKKGTEVKIFTVPIALGEKKENIIIKTNAPSKPSKEQIINQAFKFHSQGNISEAIKYYQYFIDQGFKDYRVFSNYGVILQNLGKLKEAEISYRKAIELNPDYAEAHYNLGNILRHLGQFQDAELSIRKAIEIKPNCAEGHLNLGGILKYYGNHQEAELSIRKAIEIKPNYAEAHNNLGNILKYLGKLEKAELSFLKAIEINPNYAKALFSISTLKYSSDNKIWRNKLFSKSILNSKSIEDKIHIFYARANVLHKERNFKESSKYLKIANDYKLNNNPCKLHLILNKTQDLLIESEKNGINNKKDIESCENIFIVGMHRSGSTLVESIISMNKDICHLKDVNIFEQCFIESKKIDQKLNLAELYSRKVDYLRKECKIVTNKYTYNYQFSGIIANQIPNAKIIHCFRNPLDNILSIYRTSFNTGQEYFSSLIDCARVYLDQEEIMSKYKKRFGSIIYDLNYDLLVSDPKNEIKSLISWLGWEWDNQYLSPHLNPRSVSTEANVQVRSPINSKSIGGWKNYKEMLKPAIEILTQTDKYQDIIF